MKKLTFALKQWLVAHCGVKADAEEADFRKAMTDALVDGKLDGEKFVELTKAPEDEEANRFAAKLDGIADSLTKAVAAMTAKPEEKKPEEKKDAKPEGEKKSGPTDLEKAMVALHGDAKDEDLGARVKGVEEQYNRTTKAMVYPTRTKGGTPHPWAGKPVTDFSDQTRRLLDEPSQLDRAVAGAWGKYMIDVAVKRSKSLAWLGLPQHHRDLIEYAFEKMAWGGYIAGEDGPSDDNYSNVVNRQLRPRERKALIDDATSGGVEAVPIVFDDQIVATPILQGELFPLVNVVPLDRGRRIQGARAGTVTSEWGGIDDTSITLFDTASYVSAFDTTIFRWQGSIAIGLDFLSDTPVDFAQFLTDQYGQVLLKDLDTVICTGDGTTQPEGIMTKSGTGSVAFSGATSVGAYESLRFGVHKREHQANLVPTAVFCGTNTSYSRAMAIPVGASDARRLYSTNQLPNYDGYNFMGRPYKINEGLSNSQIFYAILGKYRMYRRRGLVIRNSSEGDTLVRKNELLLACLARYGGQLERGACAAVTSDAPA